MRDNVVFSSISELKNFIPEGIRVFAIIDSNVKKIFFNKGIFPTEDIFTLDATEYNKSLETVEKIVVWLLDHQADRDAWLLGIGGGIVTDITGFVASVYKRGIRFSLVPTTLLAQVDAAIGGKTGVNVSDVKNALGTFSKAENIIIDTDFLRTLTEEEVAGGCAEVLKTFIIGDAQMFENVDGKHFPVQVVERCVQIKSDIVAQDRCESGVRQVLNLGHTLAHALEALSHGQISHGRAVAAGIIAAAKVSLRLGMCTESVAGQVEQKLSGLGYKDIPELLKAHTDIQEADYAKKLMHFIRNDKKRKEDFVNFVMISEIGKVQLRRISIGELEALIHDLY